MNSDNYILITNDKDFGDLIFRSRRPHKGIILLRLDDGRPENKINVLKRVLDSHSDSLSDNFTVVTEKSIRLFVLFSRGRSFAEIVVFL